MRFDTTDNDPPTNGPDELLGKARKLWANGKPNGGMK